MSYCSLLKLKKKVFELIWKENLPIDGVQQTYKDILSPTTSLLPDFLQDINWDEHIVVV